jgi:hypothetical protein
MQKSVDHGLNISIDISRNCWQAMINFGSHIKTFFFSGGNSFSGGGGGGERG